MHRCRSGRRTLCIENLSSVSVAPGTERNLPEHVSAPKLCSVSGRDQSSHPTGGRVMKDLELWTDSACQWPVYQTGKSASSIHSQAASAAIRILEVVFPASSRPSDRVDSDFKLHHLQCAPPPAATAACQIVQSRRCFSVPAMSDAAKGPCTRPRAGQTLKGVQCGLKSLPVRLGV